MWSNETGGGRRTQSVCGGTIKVKAAVRKKEGLSVMMKKQNKEVLKLTEKKRERLNDVYIRAKRS